MQPYATFAVDRPRTSTSVCSLKLLVYAALRYFRSDRPRTSTSTGAAERAAFRAHYRQAAERARVRRGTGAAASRRQRHTQTETHAETETHAAPAWRGCGGQSPLGCSCVLAPCLLSRPPRSASSSCLTSPPCLCLPSPAILLHPLLLHHRALLAKCLHLLSMT